MSILKLKLFLGWVIWDICSTLAKPENLRSIEKLRLNEATPDEEIVGQSPDKCSSLLLASRPRVLEPVGILTGEAHE